MYKLMIAEDEPLERKALRIILERSFFNIEVIDDAKNGIQAIKNARLQKPDIILMDIRMPEKTGLDAQKEIISFLPDAKTIILTAYSDFNYAQTAIKYGVIDYLLKPVRPSDLKKSIDKALKLINKETSSKINTKKTKGTQESAIKAAIQYINDNYTQQLTLNSVADFVHLNPQYFSRYFKSKTGYTFTQYITKLRIDSAKKLLATSDKSITQISLEVGYIDPAYFSKVFYKQEKQSPYKYKLSFA